MSARKWLLGVRPAWVRTGKGWDAAEALLAALAGRRPGEPEQRDEQQPDEWKGGTPWLASWVTS